MLPVLPLDVRDRLKKIANDESVRVNRECHRYFAEIFPTGGPIMSGYVSGRDTDRLGAIILPSIVKLHEACVDAYRGVTAESLDRVEVYQVAVNIASQRFGVRLGRFYTDGLFDDPRFVKLVALPLDDGRRLLEPAAATSKITRTKKTPHENPEVLLRGKNRVTKNLAAEILGLSERTIRTRIEEGKLILAGEGYRKMITVASLRKQIKS